MTDVERHHLEGNAALLCEEGSPRAVTRVGIHRLGGKGASLLVMWKKLQLAT